MRIFPDVTAEQNSQKSIDGWTVPDYDGRHTSLGSSLMKKRTGSSTRPLISLPVALGLAGAFACTGQIGAGGTANPTGNGTDHPGMTPANGQMGGGSMVS